MTTKLLTLLNVSAVKASKKRRVYDELISAESGKLNKRKTTKSVEVTPTQLDGGDKDVHDDDEPSRVDERMDESLDVEEDCELHVFFVGGYIDWHVLLKSKQNIVPEPLWSGKYTPF